MRNDGCFIKIFNNYTSGGRIYFSPRLRELLGNPTVVEVKLSSDLNSLLIRAKLKPQPSKDSIKLSCNNKMICCSWLVNNIVYLCNMSFNGESLKTFGNIEVEKNGTTAFAGIKLKG